jgi:ABC-type bacteriocin/lantibiotic exporter with double-glycine peptidase domain
VVALTDATPSSPAISIDRGLADATERLFERLEREHRSPKAVAPPPSPAANAVPEPLDILEYEAARRGLRADLRRLSVSDAVWLADDRLPIVAWSRSTGAWVVVRRHGLLSARIWTTRDDTDGGRRVGRGALARLLDASSSRDLVDVAILQPNRPADAASTPHAADADATHAHVPPVRRLIALMRPETTELWTIIVFSAITGLLYLALPLAVNAFISNLSFGTRSGPFVQGMVVLGSVLLLCLAVAAALRGLQHTVAEVVQRRIFVRLGSDLAHRIPNVDLAAMDRVHAPELVNRFLDVITVQKSASMLLLTGVNLVLSTVIGLTVLAFYHPFLLAFSIVLVAALAGIVFLLGRRALGTSIVESKRKYEVVDWLEELARHPRVFKGPGGIELATSRADGLVRSYLDARRAHFRILLRQISSLLALEVVAATLLLVVGGWLVLAQQLTLGQLVASEIIVSAIVASISKLGKQFEAWYDAVAAVDKLGHLVDLPLEREGGETVTNTEPAARVVATELTHARFGGRPNFAPLDFEIEPGSCVAVLGARGSGTSSVLEMLVGMRRPHGGSVSIDGLDVRSWHLPSLRRDACLLRSGDLVTGTIAENVRLGRTDIGLAETQRALELVGLGPTIRSLPDGISTPLVTGGLPLAGRQRARLLVARAIAMRPRLLLVDELLDGLDADTTEDLLAALLSPDFTSTVVIATRDPGLASRFEHTIELNPRELSVG